MVRYQQGVALITALLVVADGHGGRQAAAFFERRERRHLFQ